MRNLSCLNQSTIKPISVFAPDLPIIGSSFNSIDDSITVALGPDSNDGTIEIHQFYKNGKSRLLSCFQITDYIDFNNFDNPESNSLLLFNNFIESNQLLLVFANGDVIQITYVNQLDHNAATFDEYDPDSVQIEMFDVECLLNSKIFAAALSNDQETITLIINDYNEVDTDYLDDDYQPTLNLKMILLSRYFEFIISAHLNDKNDLKIEKHLNYVSVGWGKKETQFKGRGMKLVEREILKSLKNSGLSDSDSIRDPTLNVLQNGLPSPFDLNNFSISWRDDCDFFAISTQSQLNLNNKRRIIRIFNREGILQNISEPLDGLEHTLSWKPQSSLIATTQRKFTPTVSQDEDTDYNPVDQNKYDLDLIFIEKNGLKHGSFNLRLPLNTTINSIKWNNNNQILAIQYNNSVQLWTSKNYHWYLKKEFIFDGDQYDDSFITDLLWHDENPLSLLVVFNNKIKIINLAYKFTEGPVCSSNDKGSIAVVDGKRANFTILGDLNVPPPMYQFQYLIPDGNILDIAISKSNEIFAILSNSNQIYIVHKSLNDTDPHSSPNLISNISTSLDYFARQISFINNNHIAVLMNSKFKNDVLIQFIDISNLSNPVLGQTFKKEKQIIIAIKPGLSFDQLTFQTSSGHVYVFDDIENQIITEICTFPEYCSDYQLTKLNPNTPKIENFTSEYDLQDQQNYLNQDDDQYICFGLAKNGKLYLNDDQFTTSITSFKLTETYLIFTTAKHLLKFFHLNAKLLTLKPEDINFENKYIKDDNKKSTNNNSNHFDLNNSKLDKHYDNNIHNFNPNDERIRSIERGSLLVSVIPEKSSVVLQAPRGNLETIYPRIMVLNDIRKQIENKKYASAFLKCKTNRIDFDILYDYNPKLFLENIEYFINQIRKVDNLNLFISCLHEEDVTQTKYKQSLSIDDEAGKKKEDIVNITNKMGTISIQDDKKPNIKDKKENKPPEDSKVNKVCNAILNVLLSEAKYEKEYLRTILTSYACQNPPNLKEAFELISKIKDQDALEKSIEYLCFLQDVNYLYKVSLSYYYINLTLLIAQKSQKDPKEYLPFLNRLYINKELRRKFMIDDYLKNYNSGLNHLYLIYKEKQSNNKDYISEDDINGEIDDYVVNHNLYTEALKLFEYESIRFNEILKYYAEYLYEEHEYIESGLAYELLNDYRNAIESYIMGRAWSKAISIIEHSDDQEDVYERLITLLTEDHRYFDAGKIEYYYRNNLLEACKLYCKEYYFDEAILLVIKENRLELLEVIDDELNDGFGTLLELFSDFKGQINSQLKRLRELRQKKKQDLYVFYTGLGEANGDIPDGVSVAESMASTKESFFTRYTGKTSGTAKTGVSRRTVKNRRREERKKARGKKGTVYEEEYLINSVSRLVERLEKSKRDCNNLLEALIRRKQITKAHSLQKLAKEVILLLQENVGEIYTISEKDRERIDEYGEIYYLPEIAIPQIKDFESKKILDY
ncbi:Elongator subunit IKI3 [Ascoidea rubescens DSM 1968]|uniref:IkappaB kinase complex, IKAP component n=1 Tax=Ascoidea rubescens DSM 1968 TaxID=1344418 RepID=A0A1D2VMI0_9ASCO|nr:IkappaB kinase complex, IKAP component [Ascoidea rubescens DSM 1968]ODV62812.1 IkappaB kinase complex, IKAP component [Ascoidea rubescens DSM 1968]